MAEAVGRAPCTRDIPGVPEGAPSVGSKRPWPGDGPPEEDDLGHGQASSSTLDLY